MNKIKQPINFFSFSIKYFFLFFMLVFQISLFAQKTDSSAINKQLNGDEQLGFTLFKKTAPELVSTTLSGNKFDLSKIGDTVLVLNFWFIKCTGCIAEMPNLNKLQEDFKEKKFKIISLALNNINELKQIEDSASKKVVLNNVKLNYEIIPNCKSISEKYFVYKYPTTFLIKNGKIEQLLMNSNNQEENYKIWQKEIRKLLKK
ncbi:MAG: TlpA family protein disulfide reductase [Bacteroidetes bacterium]|nr:TlpA family protein disulfide reductase [Bacteroidota bacterium]